MQTYTIREKESGKLLVTNPWGSVIKFKKTLMPIIIKNKEKAIQIKEMLQYSHPQAKLEIIDMHNTVEETKWEVIA